MGDKKISLLTAGADADGSEEVPVVQAGSTVRITIAQLLMGLWNSGAGVMSFLQAGVGAVKRSVLARLRDNIHVTDYGTVGDNVADDWPAFNAANAVSVALKKPLFIPTPSVAYKLNPTAAMLIQHWRGDDWQNTVLNVSNSYAGEFIRILPGAVLDDLAIQTPGLTKTAGSIGVRLSAANTKDQCVHPTLRRVYIRGFDIDLDIQNVYLLHADQVQLESANYGVYCVPDASGGLGFVTAHKWTNYDFGHNGVNVYYNPPNYSNTVHFDGGNISDATGPYQAYFNKVNGLKFTLPYLENSPTIPALYFNDVDYVSIDTPYVNNTGGIHVGSGSSVRIAISNQWSTTATDVLTGADGYQRLTLRNSRLPGSGNSALSAWKTLVIENSDYNGVTVASEARGQSSGFKDNFQSGGGSITIDMTGGNEQRITVTDATAFTIAAPANAIAGQPMDLTIQNSAGGALGAITWNAVFKLAGWGSPAAGFNRTIRFRFDGASWHMVGNAPSTDVPN